MSSVILIEVTERNSVCIQYADGTAIEVCAADAKTGRNEVLDGFPCDVAVEYAVTLGDKPHITRPGSRYDSAQRSQPVHCMVTADAPRFCKHCGIDERYATQYSCQKH